MLKMLKQIRQPSSCLHIEQPKKVKFKLPVQSYLFVLNNYFTMYFVIRHLNVAQTIWFRHLDVSRQRYG